MHPRTKKRLREFGYDIKNPNLIISEPLGYLDFLYLLSEAKMVLTDSGGIQEETNILHVPCLTLRDNTERPETVEARSNIVVGVEPRNVIEKVDELLHNKAIYEQMKNSPIMFGDGHASERITDIVLCVNN